MRDLQSLSCRFVCYQSKHKTTYLHLSSSRSHGVETTHFIIHRMVWLPKDIPPPPMLCFIRSCREFFFWQGSPWCWLLPLASKGLIHWSHSSGDQSSQAHLAVESPCPASRTEVPSGPGDIALSRPKVFQQLVWKGGFSCSCGGCRFTAQRFFSSSLSGEMVSLAPLVSMQGHCSSDSGVLPVSLQVAQSFGSCG